MYTRENTSDSQQKNVVLRTKTLMLMYNMYIIIFVDEFFKLFVFCFDTNNEPVLCLGSHRMDIDFVNPNRTHIKP